jgi:hypothetical protein
MGRRITLGKKHQVAEGVWILPSLPAVFPEELDSQAADQPNDRQNYDDCSNDSQT